MQKLVRSFKDAFTGLFYCLKTQRNMFIHVVIGIVVLTAALILRVSPLEMLFLLEAIFGVLTAEVFNTALEKAVDIATQEQNDLAHVAKDVAAGAVLLTSVFAVLVGAAIFGPRVWNLIWVKP